VCVCVCMYIYTLYIYIYRHIDVYIYKHIYIYINVPALAVQQRVRQLRHVRHVGRLDARHGARLDDGLGMHEAVFHLDTYIYNFRDTKGLNLGSS